MSYEETRVKLINTQLSKLKSAAKNKTGATLRITNQKFQDEELPHVLFLTTKQTTKIRNAFANSMSTDIKLSIAEICKAIQSAGFLGSWLNILSKKVVTDLDIPFSRDILPGLVISIASNSASNAVNKFERRISGKRDVRAGKGFALFISDEDMNDAIKIIK